jgi:hypothetical protein
MSPEQIAKLSKQWREVWMASPLTEVIDLLDAELARSVEKKNVSKKSTNPKKA